MLRKPCIDCGQVGTTGPRCENCDRTFRQAKDARQTATRRARGGRPQYSGTWSAQSRTIRQNATVCWLCGDGPRPDDPWQADHLLPASMGGTGGPALPAHRSCNIARSNRHRTRTGRGTHSNPGQKVREDADS